MLQVRDKIDLGDKLICSGLVSTSIGFYIQRLSCSPVASQATPQHNCDYGDGGESIIVYYTAQYTLY